MRDLLGFENLITHTFRPGSLLYAMCEAKASPDRPYFVCLDEMNLARVEHYFAPTFTAQDAFDHQILQKLLPRLSGTGDEATDMLDALITFCNTTYPRSTQKLQRIKRRLERTGFASFW